MKYIPHDTDAKMKLFFVFTIIIDVLLMLFVDITTNIINTLRYMLLSTPGDRLIMFLQIFKYFNSFLDCFPDSTLYLANFHFNRSNLR